MADQCRRHDSEPAVLNLGLSKNVDYTYDPSKPQGSHVTSIVINGAPIDPAKSYRIGTFSFLTSGGDNFRIFTEGTNAKDSGLVDRDAWFKYLSTESASKPIAPDFTRRALNVTGAPTSVTENQQVTVKLQKLDLTSLGTPASTKVTLRYEPSGVGGGTGWSVPTAAVPAVLGTFPVTAGVATLSFKVPAELKGGRFTVTTDTGPTDGCPLISAPPRLRLPPRTGGLGSGSRCSGCGTPGSGCGSTDCTANHRSH